MPAMRPAASALAVLLGLALGAAPAASQHAGHGGGGGHGGAAAGAAPGQPYAGMERRPIKALSEAQVADLRAGRGMALALAAELNGFPGPMHVLEHADALGLTAGQRARAEALRAAMLAEAVPLGERLIAGEAALDALFARGEATPERVAAATEAVGRTSAALRAAHLVPHLAMAEALTPEQRRRYAALRGYEGGGAAGGRHGHGGDARP